MKLSLCRRAGRAGRLAIATALGCGGAVGRTAPVVGAPELVRPGIRHTVEFRVPIRDAEFDNPYDPEQVRVEAHIRGPDDRQWTVPAFWIEPCNRIVHDTKESIDRIRLVRLFVSGVDFHRPTEVCFDVDDIALGGGEGDKRVLDDFESPIRWAPAGAGVELTRVPDPDGKGHALRVRIPVRPGRAWPGANLNFRTPQDWSGYDTLYLRFRPVSGLRSGRVWIEFYNAEGRKFQRVIYTGSPELAEGGWRTIAWRFLPRLPETEWRPASEKGSWRVRFTTRRAGAYRIRVHAVDRSGEARGPERSFTLPATAPDGCVMRDGRALRFESGRGWFGIGTNLIGRNTGVYEYYLPKFAQAGCNFVRIWLSGRTLGFEIDRPLQYDQRRAAMVDYVVDLAARLNISLMFCLTDFREAGDYSPNHYWSKTAYSRLCRSPLAFFTNAAARKTYQKRLRYALARWAASTAVHSWELFNEVNLTNAWRQAPDTVRTWHAEMAAFLHAHDPWPRPVTTSFAGLEDDSIWDTPEIDIAQRHFYTDRFESFADVLVEGVAVLRRHGKPVLVGEFGRARNRYAEQDAEGVSLHNGMWAASMAGASGGALPWWWEWIDDHDLYRRFSALHEFTQGIDWAKEAFQPLPPDRVRVDAARGDSGRSGPVLLIPRRSGFRPAPWNRPVRVRVLRNGAVEPADVLPALLHGLRNHPDLHNPVTFEVDYPAEGTFTVHVGDVSGYGGAALRIRIDGRTVLEKEFPDDAPDSHESIVAFAGDYTVRAPAGKHTIEVENIGRDWFRVGFYRLDPYGCEGASAVATLGLTGRNTLLLWVRNRRFRWFNPLLKYHPEPARDVRITLVGVEEALWKADVFDPQTGKWLSRESTLRPNGNGEVTLSLGDIRADRAVRLVRQTPGAEP